MERDCESELSKLNIEQNACIYHFGASVIHGQRSNILRLPSEDFSAFLRILSLSKLLKNPNNMRGKAKSQPYHGAKKKKRK